MTAIEIEGRPKKRQRKIALGQPSCPADHRASRNHTILPPSGAPSARRRAACAYRFQRQGYPAIGCRSFARQSRNLQGLPWGPRWNSPGREILTAEQR